MAPYQTEIEERKVTKKKATKKKKKREKNKRESGVEIELEFRN